MEDEGLHPVANNGGERLLDVVFVHGLGGHWSSTWTSSPPVGELSFCWPEAPGQELPQCGIWSFGYSAPFSVFAARAGLVIAERGENLALHLKNRGLGDRPIVFVVHSLGGLVVKSMLTESQLGNESSRMMADATRGLVFCGTPHRGSDIASAAKILGRLRGRNLAQLGRNEDQLDRDHRKFVEWHNRNSSKVDVQTYVERDGFARIALLRPLRRKLVVDATSANTGIAGSEIHPVPADHLTLVKPTNRDSEIYGGVKNFISGMLKAAPSPTEPPQDPAAGVLPVLRLSDQALHDAGSVGLHSFHPQGEGEESLYVSRDLEEVLLTSLERRGLIVVSGDAGTGKTSLLWGLARRLANQENAVYLVKASYLVGSNGRQPLMDPERLSSAIRMHKATPQPTVLVDTADLLVSDERSFEALMALIGAARQGGARVLVTSRPAEAARISAGFGSPIELGAYSTVAPPGGESEFQRAVRTHALVYCGASADEMVDLAEQLLTAAVRDVPLGALARVPLSLRMLFELYAPGRVPEDVSATGLFERFWAHRVESDRRSWDYASSGAGQDLSEASLAIAATMLRTGLPETRVDHVRSLASGGRLISEAEIHALRARGIGSVTPIGEFQFFHQAFFEFCAAQLFIRRKGGLTKLVERFISRPGDYFLGAVVEQAWVSAWRPHANPEEAARLAFLYLPNAQGDLLRRLLRTLGQVTPNAELYRVLSDVLTRLEMHSVKEYLRLLPRPAVPWSQEDTQILSVVHSRTGNGPRDLVFDVLCRLVSLDNGAAQFALQGVADGSTRVLLDHDALARGTVRSLLTQVCSEDGDLVLALFRRYEVGRAGAKPEDLARVFDVLTACRGRHAVAASAWAVTVASGRRSHHTLVSALSRLLAQELNERDAIRADWSETRASFIAAVDEIRSVKPTSALAAAVAWATIRATASAGSEAALAELVDMLVSFDEPQLHSEIHDGWLSEPIRASQAIREICARVLAQGIPANHGSPCGPGTRWADTVRRALASNHVDKDRMLQIISGVRGTIGDRYAEDFLWLDPDMLSWVVLLAADAGDASAIDILNRVVRGEITMEPAAERITVQQGQRIENLGPGGPEVVSFLANRGAYVELLQMLDRVPDLPWPEQVSGAVYAALLRDGLRGQAPDRGRAVGLLSAAVREGHLRCPSWEELQPLLQVRDNRIRERLAPLVRYGLDAGTYPAATAVSLLTAWAHEPTLHAQSQIRRDALAALAAAGGPETIPSALDEAFTGNANGSMITPLARYLIPMERKGQEISIQEKVALIATVGERLTAASVTVKARRDVPSEWRNVIGNVMHEASDAQVSDLLGRVGGMAPVYAERVVARTPIRNSAEIRGALERVRDDPSLSGATRGQAELRLGEVVAPQSGAWPDLDAVLADLPT